jgi:hypothetical protein
MVLLAELSIRSAPPDFISYGDGVWWYSFAGDETYVDDEGVTFIWGDRRDLLNVRGVALGAINYTETSSIALCAASEQSFYWDNANKRLYVHHAGDANDYTIGRDSYRILAVSAGYATGVLPDAISYFDGLYFDPIITALGRLSKIADPLKFGLLSFESSALDLANADAEFDRIDLATVLGSQVRFVLMESGDTDLDDGVRLFTGYTAGARQGDERISLQLAEARLFYNRAVCPSKFSDDDYADIDFTYLGKPIPVAYGEVRRGIAVPVDTSGFDLDTGGTVTFVLADPAIDAIRAIDAVYDSNGKSRTLGTTNLTNCTVQISISAGEEIDLGLFSWDGEGYDISGTYTNGLDIMKAAFVEQAGLAYTSDNFDTTQWAAQTAALTQPVGLSIQSERGIIDEIVEPVTVSLQGVLEILGDGRVTFIPRDPDAAIARIIEQDEIIDGPTQDVQTDEVVSTVTVEYSRSAVSDEDTLQVTYSADREAVAGAYGVDTSQPISPVESVLTTSADALALAEEIAETSSAPQRIYALQIPLGTDTLNLFDVVQVDVGRYGETSYIVGEVLERSIGLDGQLFVVSLRVRELPDRDAITEVRIVDSGVLRITDDESERGLI